MLKNFQRQPTIRFSLSIQHLTCFGKFFCKWISALAKEGLIQDYAYYKWGEAAAVHTGITESQEKHPLTLSASQKGPKDKTCFEIKAGLMYYTQRFYITNPKDRD